MAASRDDVVLEYPNREKASSKATKAVVVLLMVISAVLMTVVTIGGWEKLQGARAVQIAYIAVYLLLAFFIARWRSGMLPVAAALAIILAIFAAVAGPAWLERDKDGFDDPALDAGLLGLVTLLIVPVQALLIAFALTGFRQAWHVEVEHRVGAPDHDRPAGGAVAAPA